MLRASLGAVLPLSAFDADNGRILVQTDTGQSTGGGIIAYIAADNFSALRLE